MHTHALQRHLLRELRSELGGEGEEAPVPEERFREMHRLAFAVSSIDHDAAILPKGGYIVDASHAVAKNKAYAGLSYEAAGAMANYFHFR